MTGKRNYIPCFFLTILGFSALLGTIVIVSLLYFIVIGYPSDNIEQIAELVSPQPMDEDEGKFDETLNDEKWFFEIEIEDLAQSPPDHNHKSTLEILDTTTILENDPIALAEKYRAIKNIPVMLEKPPTTYING